MFEIRINGVVVQLLQPIEKVLSLDVLHHQGFPIPIQPGFINPISEWLYDIVQRCEGIITYQRVIIEKDSVNQYKGV